MTNYNKRLDEVLKTSHHRIRTRILRDAEIYQSHILQSEYEAKQALTSLIKELVAEAMPEPGTNLTSYEAQMFIISTEEYRQNLLKALEEK